MRIVIAGAGIAGLTAALSLHAAGVRDIAVYERVDALRPLGVGIKRAAGFHPDELDTRASLTPANVREQV